MSAPLSVGIVGAGIGGLTVANALKQRGFLVKVYEQASHFIPKAGAGFGFSPNGQVCLCSIGVETRPLLHQFDKLVHVDQDGIPNLESDIFQQIYRRHGFTTGGCLRADLVNVLKESLLTDNKNDNDVLLKYSHKLVEMDQDEDSVRLVFDNGVESHHDIVIGADGIHSQVAQLLQIDDSSPIYAGANIFYGITEEPNAVLQETGLPSNSVVQGNNIGEFITFGAGPESRNVQTWATTYPSTQSPPREEWGIEPDSASLRHILSHFPTSHPIHALAANTTPNRLLHFGLFYRKHKKKWHKGRTCLLGDSCHATLPFVGQGANQAIEDSIVLANWLPAASNGDYQEAFESYYSQRFRRTRRIVKMAGIMNTLHHAQNPLLVWAREKLFESFVKGNMMAKMIEKEIVEECPVKDYAKYK